MDVRAAMSEPAEEMRRLLQEEVRRRVSQEHRIDDKLEELGEGLAALAAAQSDAPKAVPPTQAPPTQAPPTQAAPTRAPIQVPPPGETARGWQREERLFSPQQMSSPTQMQP